MKDYFLWEPVPKDWTPKTDSKTSDGKTPESLYDGCHPEKGYSKPAYQNWRRRNVTARDVVKANGGSLGPLTRALTPEMKVTLGTQFLREKAISWLWPYPEMDDLAIEKWVQGDPWFRWVEKIPDDTLLELCDKRFGVQRNDLFLTKRFPSDLPATNANGDVNYHVSTFNRWVSEWQNELAELRQGGCTFEGINLRQTLINALSTNHMLHTQATMYQTESTHALIAHLRDWLMREEEAYLAMRNKQKRMVELANGANGNAGNGAAAAPNANAAQAALLTSVQASKPNAKASALLTQLIEAMNPGAAGSETPKPLPPHLKPQDNSTAKCRGCNNVWNRSRPIPCFKACKYVDHPHYNKHCSTNDPQQKEKLTWAGFRERFPSIDPPKGLVAWEEYIKEKDTRSASKRDRSGAKAK